MQVEHVVAADEAEELLLNHTAPAGMIVEETLDLSGKKWITSLPEGLRVRKLLLNDCENLRELPRGLHCYELSARGTPLVQLPADLRVDYRLDLSNCDLLTTLPEDFKVGTCILNGCTGLQRLPERFLVSFLDLTGCVRLCTLSREGKAIMGWLNVRGCTRLQELPTWLAGLSRLDISGCASLTTFPEHLHIATSLELANTALTSLPEGLQAELLWRSVPVDRRLIFEPETITVDEVMAEENVERRRVLIERMGQEKFMDLVQAEVLDRDQDPGGLRRLLRMPMTNDEPMVYLSVQCPSTDRRYLIRVPPAMRSCHQAAAWIAGFDDPNDYHPLAET